MQFRSELILKPSPVSIGYNQKIIMLGSCFAEHIGSWLQAHYFDIVLNPFGILYNPVSIAHSLKILCQKKQYKESDLFFHQGIYHSFDHHSRFSGRNANDVITHINRTREQATEQLLQADWLIITFGTAWIYLLKDQNRIVSNCHKLPDRMFTRNRLSMDQIVREWGELLRDIRKINPKIKVLFTVSPIRHIKDTLHGNQLSKAVLLLAIDELQKQVDQVDYFPAYELLLDDLRDYRFYADDMLHPSDKAIEYIRDKFAETYFNKDTKKLFLEIIRVNKALMHKPSDPESVTYKAFLTQNIEKLTALFDKNPFFTLQKPLEEFHKRLK